MCPAPRCPHVCNNVLQYSEGGSRDKGIWGFSIFGFRCCLHHLVNGFSLRASDNLYQINRFDLNISPSPPSPRIAANFQIITVGCCAHGGCQAQACRFLTRIITMSRRLRAPGSLERPGGGSTDCKACLSQAWTARVSSPPPQKGLQVSVASRTLIPGAWPRRPHLPPAVCPASSSNLGAGPESRGAGKV